MPSGLDAVIICRLHPCHGGCSVPLLGGHNAGDQGLVEDAVKQSSVFKMRMCSRQVGGSLGDDQKLEGLLPPELKL